MIRLPESVAVVAPSPVPLRRGGAERLWDGLTQALIAAGVATDLIKLPSRELALADLMDSYEQFALLDLSHVDAVITGKYPAWMVDHPHHVVWMLHPLRGLYDSYRTEVFEHQRLPDDPDLTAVRDLLTLGPRRANPFEVMDRVRAVADRLGPTASQADQPLSLPGPFARAVVQFLDRWALDGRRVQRHAAISNVVARRTDYFPPDVEVRTIFPPGALVPGPTAELGRNFLVVSRLERIKRVDLAIEAFKRVDRSDVSLTIAGDGPDRERLQELAAADSRIQFAGRVTDDELRSLYAVARAVVVTPEREDFGYVTLEAHQHRRPVITVTDAGGPTELVLNGETGYVVDPTAPAIAAAMSSVLDDSHTAQSLAQSGYDQAAQISWERAIDQLLGSPVTRSRSAQSQSKQSGSTESRPTQSRSTQSTERGRLVAVSTYPITGAPGGGAERARHLLAALAADGWDVELVDLSVTSGTAQRNELSPGLTETTVQYSQRHHDAESQLRLVTGEVAITDVAASLLWPSTPVFVRELTAALDGAAGVILVQPFLQPAIADLAPQLPIIYDSHNHEHGLKARMFPANEGGQWLLEKVRQAEESACRSARLITVTTDEDRIAMATDHSVDPDRIAVIPNGVDTTTVKFTSLNERHSLRNGLFARYQAASEIRRIALFIGSGHGPNVEAGQAVLELASKLPDTLFLLAGKHCEQLTQPRTTANVRLLGTVSDQEYSDLLASADVALNPMSTGGGSNLKLLSYLAAGVPVVSTELGARGLRNASELMTIAPIERFAEAVRSAVDGPDPERLAAARSAVELQSEWSVLGALFATLVGEVIA